MEANITSPTPTADCPSQSAVHITHAAETIVGFDTATPAEGVTGVEEMVTLRDLRLYPDEDVEMSEYTRQSEREHLSNEEATQYGEEDSYVCTRSGFGASFDKS